MPGTVSSPPRPTTGYYLLFAVALVGMVLTAVAVAGTWRALHGAEPLGAFNTAGVPMLVFAWALAYFARLAFSTKSSDAARARVRAALRVMIALAGLAAIAGAWFVLTNAVATAELRAMAIAGAIAALGGALWLWRYSGA